jgi:hypothetical protein
MRYLHFQLPQSSPYANEAIRVYLLCKLSDSYANHPAIKKISDSITSPKFAEKVVSKFLTYQFDNEISKTFTTKEVSEVFMKPDFLLRYRVGDCDDHACMLAGLLTAAEFGNHGFALARKKHDTFHSHIFNYCNNQYLDAIVKGESPPDTFSHVCKIPIDWSFSQIFNHLKNEYQSLTKNLKDGEPAILTEHKSLVNFYH